MVIRIFNRFNYAKYNVQDDIVKVEILDTEGNIYFKGSANINQSKHMEKLANDLSHFGVVFSQTKEKTTIKEFKKFLDTDKLADYM